jgi:hypothetical protein
MKITTITFESKRSDGNWGNDVVRFEAAPREGEDPLAVLQALKLLVDAQFNGERRKAEYDRQLTILAAEGSTNEQRQLATRYVEKFDEWAYGVKAAESILEYER